MALAQLLHDRANHARPCSSDAHHTRYNTAAQRDEVANAAPVQVAAQHHVQLATVKQSPDLRRSRIDDIVRIQARQVLLQMRHKALLERRLAASDKYRGPHVLDEEGQGGDRGDVIARDKRLVVDHRDLQAESDAHPGEQLEAYPRARGAWFVYGVYRCCAGGGEEGTNKKEGSVVAPPGECAV